MGYKSRDVEIVELENGDYLVAACDSCGAVGSKAMDQVKVPATLVGQFTAQAALMEVAAVGAVPKIMTVAISAEPDPTGNEIMAGVRQALASEGIADLPMAVSTEKNIPTSQTGLGIGVSGICPKEGLRIAGSCPGDLVFVLGRPEVGTAVAGIPESERLRVSHIMELLNISGVHDVVPVGSRGILAEINDLANQTNTSFDPIAPSPVDLHTPAGPSTCAVYTADPLWTGLGTKQMPGSVALGRLTKSREFL